MAQELVAEALKVEEVQVNKIALREESKEPVVHVVEVAPLCSSSQTTASEPAEEILPLKITNQGESNRPDVQSGFPYTSSPRNIKRRRQATHDDYVRQHEKVSHEQHLLGNIPKVFSVKRENADDSETRSIPDSKGKNPAPSKPQTKKAEICNVISEAIILDVLRLYTDDVGSFGVMNYGYAVRYIANTIENYIDAYRSELKLKEEVNKSGMIPINNVKAVKQAYHLIQLAANRTKMAETLSLSNPDCYTRIIPTCLVAKLLDPGAICVNDAKWKKKGGNLVRCIADTQKGKKNRHRRCTEKVSKGMDETRPWLEKLSNLPKPQEFAKVAEILFEIIKRVFCEQWHSKKARYGVYKLCRHFYGVIDEEQKADREIELLRLRQWLSDLVAPLQQESAPNKSGEESHGRSVEKAEQVLVVQANFLFKEKDYPKLPKLVTAVFNFQTHKIFKHFVPYELKKTKRCKPAELIINTKNAPLAQTDKSTTGSVYIFWNVGAFEWVKIGHTKMDATDRVKQWAAQCVGEEEEYDIKHVSQVRHPLRVEQLVHAELQEQRYEDTECHGCGGCHNEWFKTGFEMAEKSVLRWAEWMEDDPYDEQGYIRDKFKASDVDKEPSKTFAVKSRGRRGGQQNRRSSRIRNKKAAVKEVI